MNKPPLSPQPTMTTTQGPEKDPRRHGGKPPFATNIAQEELFLMDSYYKELMQKERQAFERILASKLNVHEREVERKYQK